MGFSTFEMIRLCCKVVLIKNFQHTVILNNTLAQQQMNLQHVKKAKYCIANPSTIRQVN